MISAHTLTDMSASQSNVHDNLNTATADYTMLDTDTQNTHVQEKSNDDIPLQQQLFETVLSDAIESVETVSSNIAHDDVTSEQHQPVDNDVSSNEAIATQQQQQQQQCVSEQLSENEYENAILESADKVQSLQGLLGGHDGFDSAVRYIYTYIYVCVCICVHTHMTLVTRHPKTCVRCESYKYANCSHTEADSMCCKHASVYPSALVHLTCATQTRLLNLLVTILSFLVVSCCSLQ